MVPNTPIEKRIVLKSDEFSWDSMINMHFWRIYVCVLQKWILPVYWTRSQVSRTWFTLIQIKPQIQCTRGVPHRSAGEHFKSILCKLNQLTFVTIKEHTIEIKSIQNLKLNLTLKLKQIDNEMNEIEAGQYRDVLRSSQRQNLRSQSIIAKTIFPKG